MTDGPFVRSAKRMLEAARYFDDVFPSLIYEHDPFKREEYIGMIARTIGQPHEFVRKCLEWYESVHPVTK